MSGLWWHVYGAETPDGWVTIFGAATRPPDEQRQKLPAVLYTVIPGEFGVYLPYLASFDREPTDAEMAVFEPERYRDEDTVA